MRKLYKSLLAVIVSLPLSITGLNITSFAATVPNMPEDLVAYYTFDDSANLGKDSTANANNLDKTINSANISCVDGENGKAVYFAGSAGLAIADQTNPDKSWKGDFMDNIGGAFTISYYAKIDTSKALNDTNARVFCNGIDGAPKGATSLVKYLSDGNKVQFISCVGGTDWWSGCATLDNAASSWHHYVMVYDPDQEKFSTYVDGEKKVDLYADSAEELGTDWNFCIGGAWSQMTWYSNATKTEESFIGSVDEFKVFNKAVYDMDYIENAGHPVEEVTTTTTTTTTTVGNATTTKANTTDTTLAQTTTAAPVENVKTGDTAPIAVMVLLSAAAATALALRKKTK